MFTNIVWYLSCILGNIADGVKNFIAYRFLYPTGGNIKNLIISAGNMQAQSEICFGVFLFVGQNPPPIGDREFHLISVVKYFLRRDDLIEFWFFHTTDTPENICLLYTSDAADE